MIDWHMVSSSAIHRIGFDGIKSQLHIDFVDRGVYSFCGFSRSKFNEFLSTASKGKYFNQHVAGQYQC